MDKNTKIVLATAIIATVIVAGIMIATIRLNSTGKIVTVGLEASIDYVDWGNVSPNSTYSCSFELTNTKSGIGVLSIYPENMPSYLSLYSDSEGVKLAPQQTRTVTVFLSVSADAPETDFSFIITCELKGIPIKGNGDIASA